MSYEEQPEHVDEKDLELYLKEQLSQELASAVDAHLAACGDCAQKLSEQDKCLWYLAELSADDVPRDGEKRRHPRLPADDPASLQVLEPFSAEKWDVRIVDVSLDGLRAHTARMLAPGSLIKVKMRYSVACGDVRYCVAADNGFYAGVRLHDYFRADSAGNS